MGTVNLDAVRYWTGDSLTPAELAALYAEELPVISAGGVIGKPPYHKTRLGTGQYDNVDGVLSTNAKDNWSIVGNVNGDTAADTRIRLQPTTTSTPLEYWLSRLATLNSAYSPTGSQWLEFSGTTNTGASSGDAYEGAPVTPGLTSFDFDATITTPFRGKAAILASIGSSGGATSQSVLSPYWLIGSGAQSTLDSITVDQSANSIFSKYGSIYLDWWGNVSPSIKIVLSAYNTLIEPFNSAIAGWKFKETSGSRADFLGNITLTDNNTVTGSVDVTTLVSEASALFTKANSEFLSAAAPASLTFADDTFSVGGWVLFATSAADAAILGKWDTGTKEYLLWFDNTTNRFKFSVTSDGSTVVSTTASTFGAPSDSTWYFLYAYHDADNDVIGISVNNGTRDTAAHTTGIYSGTADFIIGADTDGAANFFDGAIDEVVFYDRVLTTTETAYLYAVSTTSGTPPHNLVDSLSVDFITLLPEPSAKITIDSTPSLSSGDRLNITGKTALVEDASASYTQLYGATHEGEPITVEPGQYNVITLMQADEGAAYLVAATAIVDIDIIPRWTMPGGLVA